MTESILNDCLLLKDQPLQEMRAYFSRINLTIFDDLIDQSQDKEVTKQIILYIICAYSEDSPLLIIRNDMKAEKESICEYLHIPEFARFSLLNLKEPSVRKAATAYVTQFAGQLFKTLCFLKIQYCDFELDITNREFRMIRKEDDPENAVFHYDIKEHGKAIAEMTRIGKQIEQIEKEIKAKVKQMDGIAAFKAFKDSQDENGKLGKQKNLNIENQI